MKQNGRPAPALEVRRLNPREVWRAAKRNPLLCVGIPLMLVASTAFFLWWTVPVYEAAATVRVDEERSGVAILEALQTLSSGSKISTEMEELRSRTLAEEVVDSLNLHVAVRRPRRNVRHELIGTIVAGRDTPPGRYTLKRGAGDTWSVQSAAGAQGSTAAGEPLTLPGMTLALAPGAAEHAEIVVEVAPFDEAVRRFRRTAGVSRPNREADFIAIRYDGADRYLVRDVPNLMARRFIERRNDVRTREARSTAEFLDEQIAVLSAQLGTAEEQLRRYREQYGVVSLEAEGQAQVSRLADMQATREMLDIERASLATSLRQIEAAGASAEEPSPYRALLGAPSLIRNPATSDLLRSLHDLEAERAKFLDRRTLDDPEVKVLTDQIAAIERQLQVLAHTFVDGLSSQVASMDRTLAGFAEQLQRIPEKELQIARLRRQSKVSEELYAQLQLRLKEAEIMAAVVDPSVRVVDASILPRRPVRPQVPLTVALAIIGGLILGFGSAVVKEQVDDTVRTRDELQNVGGVPVLGSIPRIAAPVTANGERRRFLRRTADHVAARIVDDDAGSPVTEAYRSLRTNINFSQVDTRPRVLVVTSPAPGDGKSTTAANLAVTMTRQGLRCLLIDADLRRGALHDVFGVRRGPGLSDVLFGNGALNDVINRVADRPDFVPTGPLPPNPAELLGSAGMADLIRAAREAYDTVVIDAPPMNLVTDAAVLARSADGVVVVARAGVTSRSAIVYTFEQLSGVRARVLGSVLNDADVRRESHYGSYMQTYYHADG